MDKHISEFLNQKRFAVAGSFRNESKFAYKVLRFLIEGGYNVYPVNPGMNEVEGIKCYKSIVDIPFVVDVINIVTPPKATEEILKECLRIGVKRVWIQPGAESESAIQFCKANNISVIHGVCVMLESLRLKD